MNIFMLLQFTLSTLTKDQFIQKILPFTDVLSDHRVRLLSSIFDIMQPSDLERLTLFVSVVIHNNYTLESNMNSVSINELIQSFDYLLKGNYTCKNYLFKMNIEKNSSRAKRFRYCYSTIRSKFKDCTN